MSANKFFLAFIIGVVIAASLSGIANAATIVNTCNESPPGLVPCGRAIDKNGFPICPCQIYHIFYLVINIYNFIIWYISIPLAGLLIVIGGTILLISAGNPRMTSWGREILWGAIIGILLIWCAWLIIYTLLLIIGVRI